jgi:hypothetical protein
MIKYAINNLQSFCTYDNILNITFKKSGFHVSYLKGNQDDSLSHLTRYFCKFAYFENEEIEDLRKGNLVPVYLIAIGATEYYGPNRNGDGFNIQVCKKYHPTFTKYANFYRNHQNKDPNNKYGIVKLSTFNDEMNRIELLVYLFGNEKTANKYKGKVADRELNLLFSQKDFPVSMACKVSYDICSICGHRSTCREEYCRGINEGGTCPGGGLYTKMGSILRDGRQLYAINPDPIFFDISHVIKPADRTAWTLGIVPLQDVIQLVK